MPALREKGHNWPNLAQVRSLWEDQALFFYFEAWFDCLRVNSTWGAGSPTQNLSDHDVVEAFLRPERSGRYFEFEVSPLGQWLDMCVLKPRVEVGRQLVLQPGGESYLD